MDREELKEMVETHAPSVYRLAYARTGDREDAEDVMQEVFLRLVRSAPELRDGEHCRAWLLRVTVNCAASLHRSPWRRRTQPLDENMADEAWDGPEENGVLEAVLALPPQYRVPVHLYYYEGLSVKETAQAMGKSEQTVKTRLHRARAMLKERLKGAYEDA